MLVTDMHAVLCEASGGNVFGILACGFLDSSVYEIVCELVEDLVVCRRLNASGCMRS